LFLGVAKRHVKLLRKSSFQFSVASLDRQLKTKN